MAKYKIGNVRGPEGPAGKDASVTSENIEKALGYTPANQTDVEKLSEEFNSGSEEIFYTKTGEEHHWDGMEQILCFDLTTPIVAGNSYIVTIDGVVYNVTAVEGETDWEDENGDALVIHYVELTDGEEWSIKYGTEIKEHEYLSSFNTHYVPAPKYYTPDENDEAQILIPHSLKISQGQTLADQVANIIKNTIELSATYEDGTTETFVVYGEVKS